MTMPLFRHFRLETDEAGRVTVWIDVAGRSVNVFDDAVIGELAELVEQFHAAPPAALLLRSAKARGFAAGADLKYLASLPNEAAAERFLADGQQALDRLESLPCPTVAVIHGTCLGGGLEVALACRYRSAARDPGTLLGLPETTLGLIPGWGGTQRLPERIGTGEALRLMLTGAPVPAAEAFPLGLVDALHGASDAAAAVLAGAIARPAAARDANQGRQESQASTQQVSDARSRYCAGGATPAQEAVLASVAAGIAGSRQDALRAERLHCARLLFTPECRERLEAFFRA
jgi:3-hydroxyacyl-CoA dehydrogenase/enoyl-CoA hydratase/3-hydroxybutyryl-CoA epimerase